MLIGRDSMTVQGGATAKPTRDARVGLDGLLRLQEALRSARDERAIAAAAVDCALRDFAADAACVLVPSGDAFRVLDARGYPDGAVEALLAQPRGARNAVADALSEGEPLLSGARREPDASDPPARHAPVPARAILPLAFERGPSGALLLDWGEERAFSADDRKILEAFAGQVADSLARVRSADEPSRARRTLDDFFATASIGLHSVAPDGTILWANEADCRLVGVPLAEYVGRNVAEFHVDRDNVQDILARLASGERILNRPATLRAKDGTLRHVLIDSSGHFEKGVFVHTRCFTRDVTALEEQRKRYEALVATMDQLGDGIAVLNPDRVLWCTEAYAKLFGFTREEMLDPAFRPRDLIPAEEAERISRVIAERPGRQLQRYETWVLRKDGSRFLAEVSVKVLDHEPGLYRIAVIRDVTSAREADRQMREQRDLYDALLRAESDLGQGVVLTQGGRRIQYANDAFARIVGRSVQELCRPDFELMSLVADEERARLARDLDTGDPAGARHYRTRLLRPDGTTVPVEAASLGVTIDGVLYRLGLCRDMSEAEKREDERRSRETFLKDATLGLLEAARDPDETLRVATRFATQRLADFANVDVLDETRELRRVVATAADEAKRPLLEQYLALYPATERTRRMIESIPLGEALLANDVPRDAIEAASRSEHETRLIEEIGLRHALVVPLAGRSGLLGALTFTRSRDEPFSPEEVFVAKSLAARAGLAYETARLYAHHQRILDTAPVQILTVDASGRILSVNRTVRGDDPRRVLGRNAFDFLAPEDRERVESLVLGAIRTGVPCEYETRGLVEPGVLRWFNVRVGPLDLGGRRGAVLVSTDVHDRKAIEREIADVRAQLIRGEKLAALGSLVAGLAHELRTPLTFLSNNTYLLEHRLARAAKDGASASTVLPDVQPFLGDIREAVQRINLLVEDLRKYTKARVTAHLDVQPLDSLLTEAIEIFRSASRSSHPIEQALAATRPVRANRGAVQQLALNLLQNAAEASPPGSAIRIVTRDEAGFALLEVEDHGSGISAEVRDRMFEPLFTTKPEGTGLGLSIVRRIAEEHGATIEVETDARRGTTFRVRFPVA